MGRTPVSQVRDDEASILSIRFDMNAEGFHVMGFGVGNASG